MDNCDLGDDEVDAALTLAVVGFDPNDTYPEWSNRGMREAYRAGWEDRAAQSDPTQDGAMDEDDALADIERQQREAGIGADTDLCPDCGCWIGAAACPYCTNAPHPRESS